MKKMLLLAVLLLPAPGAMAQGAQYTRALMVMGAAEGYDAGMAMGLGYGAHLPDSLRYLSLEGDASKNFSHMSQHNAGTQIKRSYARAAVYAAVTYPVDPRFDIKGRIGVHYTSYQDRDGGTDGVTRGHAHGMDTGVGVLVHFRVQQDIVVEYTTTTLNDFTQLIIGMQFTF